MIASTIKLGHYRLMTLDFSVLATATLKTLQNDLETAFGDDLTVELIDGVLTLIPPHGRPFIINKHQPTQQLWLASPISGAWHFAYNPATQHWLSTRGDQVSLTDLLTRELNQAIP